ncbi:hypothetical protein RHGRI_008168 [Rhododendron griersonianum]|uniref:CBS domain-containing protein n=1 Tax=Rhododendron griersonianum TaxID=479676 RepID=A0AAV6L0G9_9ERIC|nr:hypothetical protein RHGRI_008168 [Rhododendron griersonianum]
MLDEPGHVVSLVQLIRKTGRIPIMKADEELSVGVVYLVVLASRARCKVSESEMMMIDSACEKRRQKRRSSKVLPAATEGSGEKVEGSDVIKQGNITGLSGWSFFRTKHPRRNPPHPSAEPPLHRHRTASNPPHLFHPTFLDHDQPKAVSEVTNSSLATHRRISATPAPFLRRHFQLMTGLSSIRRRALTVQPVSSHAENVHDLVARLQQKTRVVGKSRQVQLKDSGQLAPIEDQ